MRFRNTFGFSGRPVYQRVPAVCLLAALWLQYPAVAAPAPPATSAAPAASQAPATAEQAQANARLAAVRANIAALTDRLAGQLRERDALSARLREAELAVTAARRKLDGLHRAQLDTKRTQAELHAEHGAAQRDLEAQRSVLAAEVRAAYLIGGEEPIKLLLNQSDPKGLARLLTLYGYFVRERGAKIDAVRVQVERLEELKEKAEQADRQIEVLAGTAADEMTALQQARSERAGALLGVTAQMNGGNQELAQLKREEQALENLVAELADSLPDFPLGSVHSFGDLRGKLPWPVAGRLTTHTPENWNGIQIETQRGAKVRAPYFGRVVYADWLQGLGLLLIIGHNGNYMTLYGHAEVLYKSVGDWVAPGDVVAAMSDASGAAPELYFEIRAGRKAVDPKSWLTTAP